MVTPHLLAPALSNRLKKTKKNLHPNKHNDFSILFISNNIIIVPFELKKTKIRIVVIIPNEGMYAACIIKGSNVV